MRRRVANRVGRARGEDDDEWLPPEGGKGEEKQKEKTDDSPTILQIFKA